MPRSLDERAAADLFFADLTGRSRPRWLARAGEAEALAEDVVRSSVINPGWQSWNVMSSSRASTQSPGGWAGAIRQKSDASAGYTGWERKSETFTIEKVSVGTALDIVISANVKGQLKGQDDAFYVMEATVTAAAPRDLSATRRKQGVVDVEVGFETRKGRKRTLHFVKTSWDRDKACARLDIPIRVTFRTLDKPTLPPDEFVVTWFGNGDPPITPFSTP